MTRAEKEWWVAKIQDHTEDYIECLEHFIDLYREVDWLKATDHDKWLYLTRMITTELKKAICTFNGQKNMDATKPMYREAFWGELKEVTV